MNTAEKLVSVIPERKELQIIAGRTQKKRVAGYCRVSTDQEEQQNSYQNQIDYYTNAINKNTEWTMVGIFADQGISGVSAKKRPEFMRLLGLCRKGKVDLILTKSVSRFSRNNADFINIIRELKSLDVGIYFEKENINTLFATNEILITLLGALAQGEIESLSGNVKTGIRMGFKNGNVRFQYKKMLGYCKSTDGNPEIISEEAEIVRKIYAWYLAGLSLERIREQILATPEYAVITKVSWSRQTLQNILQNEKFCGNALQQKSFVKDCITKKVIKNTGQVPQYFIRGNHEGIVTEELWMQVQEELRRRSCKRKVSEKNAKTEQGKYSSKFALTERLFCADCGTAYRRTSWQDRQTKALRNVWRCVNRMENGPKYCTHSPTLDESKLHSSIVRAINALDDDREFLISLLTDVTMEVYGGEQSGTNPADTQKEIDKLNTQMMELVENGVKSGADMDALDCEFQKISGRIKELQAVLRLHERQVQVASLGSGKVSEILETLRHMDFGITEYSEIVVRQLIKNIKVLAVDKVEIYWEHGEVTAVDVG